MQHRTLDDFAGVANEHAARFAGPFIAICTRSTTRKRDISAKCFALGRVRLGKFRGLHERLDAFRFLSLQLQKLVALFAFTTVDSINAATNAGDVLNRSRSSTDPERQ